jgi:hypothetical protein
MRMDTNTNDRKFDNDGFPRLKDEFKKLTLAFVSVGITLFVLEIGMRIWICHFASERHVLKYASVEQLEKKMKILNKMVSS